MAKPETRKPKSQNRRQKAMICLRLHEAEKAKLTETAGALGWPSLAAMVKHRVLAPAALSQRDLAMLSGKLGILATRVRDLSGMGGDRARGLAGRIDAQIADIQAQLFTAMHRHDREEDR